MADYWKSQDRKYCEFCKCWIADNKPSRDFHENGRRHKENVKKKLNTITKNSAREFRNTERIDASIKAMESAALEAYRKDVENNADWTSIAINKKIKEDNLAISSGSKKLWQEAKTRDGKSYYYNSITNETVWVPPPEGYASVEEQRDERDNEAAKQLKQIEKIRQREGLLKMQQVKKEEEEMRARLEREKLKERRVKEESPEPVYGPILEPGKTDPYGGWQTVKESAPVMDLQLPKQEYFELPVEIEPEPPVKEFKEKTVENLNEYIETDFKFKKRKIMSGAKRNTRQRLDDD